MKTKMKIEVELKCPCGRVHRERVDPDQADVRKDGRVSDILTAVSKKTGVSVRAILGPSRAAVIARARGIVMARIVSEGYSFADAARAVNVKNWNTARAAFKKWQGE